MKECLIKTLEEFKKKKVIVLGDIILDKFRWGKIDSLNPEQPAAPKVKIKNETYALGGAANVANNVVSMGASCKLYGLLGKDDYSKKIKQICEERGIDLNSYKKDSETITKQRIMAHGQQITRLDYGEFEIEQIKEETKKLIINDLKKDLQHFEIIILSDYKKGFFDEGFGKEIINLANSLNIKTIVDSKPSNINCFKNCTLIRPNKHEAEEMTRVKYINDEKILEEIGKRLCEIVNSKCCVITCGGDGAFGYEKNGSKSTFIPSKAKSIADVAGAGDTFAAALTLSLASGRGLKEAIILANYAAGIVVEKIGTATASAEEIRKKIEDDNKV